MTTRAPRHLRVVAVILGSLTSAVTLTAAAFSTALEPEVADALTPAREADLATHNGPLAGMRLRLVPAGTAILGDRTGANPDAPMRPVVFSRPFWLGECEVTQAQWRAVMGTNPSVVLGDDLPVERISYNDCQDFLRALNARAGSAYRLPNADEWEYARRAGSSALSIAEEERVFANAAASYAHRRMLDPANTCPANAWGLRGMDGNAWEWVTTADPDLPERRLMCGGSCNMVPRWCRPEARLSYPPDFIHERRGIRIALDAD